MVSVKALLTLLCSYGQQVAWESSWPSTNISTSTTGISSKLFSYLGLPLIKAIRTMLVP